MKDVKKPPLFQENQNDDKTLDFALRPETLNDYVGQTTVKNNLSILVEAAKKRHEPLEHILIHGPAGLGKTTLAFVIAKEFGSGIRITSGTALEKAGDVGSILTGLNVGDFLFIDEVHRLNKAIEETLYPAMENFKLDIVIGKGPSAKTLEVKVPQFTLIAATTKTSLLSHPFRSRFGAHYKLAFYNTEEIEQIIGRSAKLLGIGIDRESRRHIAACARSTPRIANRLLKRVRDFAQVHNNNIIDIGATKGAMSLLGIDALGLESMDRLILSAIAKQFNGGPAGIKSIAAAVAEEGDTIEEVYEPYLMQLGFIARTSRGRIITNEGLKHIGLPPTGGGQGSLV